MNLQKYLDEFNEGVFQMNSSSLCTLLSIRHKDPVEKFSPANTCDLFEKYVEKNSFYKWVKNDPPGGKGLTNHIEICQTLLYKSRLNDIVQYQYLLCRLLLDLIKESKNKNWHIPILILTLTDLCLLTNYFTSYISRHTDGNTSPPSQRIADLSIDNDRQTSEANVTKTIELLTEAFRVCTSDRCTEQRLSKKWGAIQILNQLLSFAEQSLEFRHYLLEDQKIIYDYFLATECFDPIFQRCPRFMKKNKASILIHLCVSKMQFGHTPSLQIIAKYKLDAFHNLLVSIKEGQLYAFDQYIRKI
ncbi:unnamed protein product, partial [Adineta steineri]